MGSSFPIRYRLDGRWLAPGEAAFAPSSGLVMAGEGWFETLRVEGGRPMFLPEHLARLGRSVAAALGAEHAECALHSARACLNGMSTAFDELPCGRLRLLLALDSVGEAWQALGEWGPHVSSSSSLEGGLRAVVASLPHPGLGVLGKSASYHWSIAARREALARGAGEALLVRDGRVFEGATGALVWRRGGRWYTDGSPAVLPSVTLDVLRRCGVDIGAARLSVGDLGLTTDRSAAADVGGASRDAARIEGLVLVSALRLAVAVREVDGVALPTAAALEAAAAWREALRARHAAERP